MAYKMSRGKRGFGDIEFEDDADTGIDFAPDQISLETSGTVRMNITNDGVYIPDTPADYSLKVSGAIEITPGTSAGITFKKSESEINFIKFANASDGTSYNAYLAYQAAEHLYIAPGRGADFYIQARGPGGGDQWTFPFRVMDDGTARFEKGLEDSATSVADLTASTAFYVSGTQDGNNNAVFLGRVGIGTATPDYTLDVAGNIGVDQYIRHNDNGNTHINFTVDKINLKAGNKSMVTMEEKGTSPHEVTINDGSNNIDFVVKGNGSNEGNPLLMCDASNNRVGINGVGSPEHELHVDGTGKFTTSIRTGLIEYTDGDDAITIEDGGYLKFHAGVRYARSVQVSSGATPAASSPNKDGGWIKFATFVCPGGSNLDTAASSFLVTIAGGESSTNRKIDGIFMVHAKFTNNNAGNADGGSNYYEQEGTRISVEPLNADFLSAAGNDAPGNFDPTTDLSMIFTNSDSTPTVDLYIRACSKDKYCFVTHLGGTGQNNTNNSDIGWTINTGQSWSATEPAAPGGSVKITGTWVSKVFSKVGIGTNSPKFDLDVSGSTRNNGAVYKNTKEITSFPYAVADDDYIISVAGTGTPRRINLPAKAEHTGRILIIKDATGNANSNNIEIKPDGSENIDGAGDKLINTNKTALTIVCALDQWLIIGNYPG